MKVEIQVGDVVKLNSGGPNMAIESIDKDDNMSCTWFEGSQRLSSAFHKDLLKKVTPIGNTFKVGRG
ncbi:YodC family protein [Legionella sp. PC997]|uniref:YodC family protein n=1 Tax=Legionella sp. PC997 TaxID=2755562 RepID=UPI0015F82F0D|nr:DUF2158 domain-containing protein [Legionella sp. PC997]QMT59712.1 hypothetical protein HBNCFIEN_01079 [Legionella sp. PC997]